LNACAASTDPKVQAAYAGYWTLESLLSEIGVTQ
jgi:hypothetical protein